VERDIIYIKWLYPSSILTNKLMWFFRIEIESTVIALGSICREIRTEPAPFTSHISMLIFNII